VAEHARHIRRCVCASTSGDPTFTAQAGPHSGTAVQPHSHHSADELPPAHCQDVPALGPLVGSLLAGWARSRLGTLAPLIIIHNASNLVIPLATLWLCT
jgi:hypothetical protein